MRKFSLRKMKHLVQSDIAGKQPGQNSAPGPAWLQSRNIVLLTIWLIFKGCDSAEEETMKWVRWKDLECGPWFFLSLKKKVGGEKGSPWHRASATSLTADHLQPECQFHPHRNMLAQFRLGWRAGHSLFTTPIRSICIANQNLGYQPFSLTLSCIFFVFLSFKATKGW